MVFLYPRNRGYLWIVTNFAKQKGGLGSTTQIPKSCTWGNLNVFTVGRKRHSFILVKKRVLGSGERVVGED